MFCDGFDVGAAIGAIDGWLSAPAWLTELLNGLTFGAYAGVV